MLLLDVIRNIPSYVKFFKDLIFKKRTYELDEKLMVSKLANVMVQQDFPLKLKDLENFSINITLGNTKMPTTILDLKGSINLYYLKTVLIHYLFFTR